MFGKRKTFILEQTPFEYFFSHKQKVRALTQVIMHALQEVQSTSGQVYLPGIVDYRTRSGVLGYLRANHGYRCSNRILFVDKVEIPNNSQKGTLIHIHAKERRLK